MIQQKVIISHDLRQTLGEAIAECPHDRMFVLCDETTREACLPMVADFECMQGDRRAHV